MLYFTEVQRLKKTNPFFNNGGTAAAIFGRD